MYRIERLRGDVLAGMARNAGQFQLVNTNFAFCQVQATGSKLDFPQGIPYMYKKMACITTTWWWTDWHMCWSNNLEGFYAVRTSLFSDPSVCQKSDNITQRFNTILAIILDLMASMLLPLKACQQINDGKTSTAFDKIDSPGQAHFHFRGGTGKSLSCHSFWSGF